MINTKNIRNKTDIRVYNECPFQTNLVGQKREYIFPPCVDGEPTMNFVSFDEIEYAHSRGKSFTIGLLVFAEDEEEDIYEALGIKNWKNTVWRNNQIEDIILHPSLEKMLRVIDVKDKITLERIRGMMVRFINEKRDVSQNVINVVNARFKELNAGNVNSKIEVRATDVEAKVSASEVDALKQQIEEMQKLISQMQNPVQASAVDNNTAEPVDTEVRTTTSTRSRSGRKTTPKK